MQVIVDHLFPPRNGGAAWARGDTEPTFSEVGFWKDEEQDYDLADLEAMLG